ncbi:ZEB2-regulated ABC transporter 1 [Podospora australis]|uniref:ZEB2-regulated ABC transporter 1 n=1 Tax=Podospora australis TaxID=1536484 RepID=A0AAN6WMR3_9PEZI|nr:ZEB2-regulated ABC transporter 1 [Podospora australis]
MDPPSRDGARPFQHENTDTYYQQNDFNQNEQDGNTKPIDIDEQLQGVGQLARRISYNGERDKPLPDHASSGNRALNPEPGSNLDPKSPTFDPRAWVKEFLALTESDPKSAPRRALGVAFRDLSVYGWNTGAQFQKSVGNVVIALAKDLVRLIGNGESRKGQRMDILRDFEGVVEQGEMLLVLGPPGAGCSTLLKTLAQQTRDLEVDTKAYINYRGIDQEHIRRELRGDVLYNAELDTHLAHLTVGETLSFASLARSVRHTPGGFTRKQFALVNRDVMMAIFGLTHTVDTRVGDDVIRGVSGGERKRVSIAEAALTGAKLQCWDNSTRGLDSANAINFCRNLRLEADLLGVASAVSLYQAPQSAYDLFDRVTVIYEGRQIFFGRTTKAKAYFESLGFVCPDRQTIPDFLTSMTSARERVIKPGCENLVPRTPDEFAVRWRESTQRQEVLQELDNYEVKHPSGQRLAEYQSSRKAEQARTQRSGSPYTISYAQQVSLAFWRAWRRLLADPGFTIASLLFNLIMALILGSMFYNLKPDSSSFYYRGGIIFFSLMFNAFASQLEVLTIYAERPIVEKQNRYAFYHQSAQAVASYLCDLPYKIINMFVFNIVVYFMANLRREAGAFFFFCLVTLLATLTQSAIFRTLASTTRTPDQAMIPSALLGLGLIIYTGFTLPTAYMPGWSRWMAYINPLAYSFEALMANEFTGREFGCAGMVPQGPGYDDLPSASRICSVVGAEPGSDLVNGDRYINLSFEYYNSNRWRNVGIIIGFMIFFFGAYLVMAEFAKPPKTRGEILVFRRGHSALGKSGSSWNEKGSPMSGSDLEAHVVRGNTTLVASKQAVPAGHGLTTGTSVFHWEDLTYDIKVKGGERRLLDHMDGWVKPGVSTILMGVSGAGKTTLLDVLATRVSIGVVGGDTLINGVPTDATFQHQVGYVQQQDLHLSTMTVREALEFSALLRQSADVSRAEKLKYVDHVIDILEMREFAGAVIGVPGEGLNVEQRKRLTIGVELAARPQLLIFFDEPTSGLDSQTSWAIATLIRKLANSGQAVLCTIHQPSAILFNQFDRLLLIAPGGKTVYFGDLGQNASTLIQYFESNGAPAIPADANPAEWMLKIIEPPKDGSKGIDWHAVWRSSPEFSSVKKELARLRSLATTSDRPAIDTAQHKEFTASFSTQFWEVMKRITKHFWRSPVYIWSKIALIVLSSLYLGFSYSANNSIQGLQNQLWAIFMFLVLFININEQIMPMFVPQRNLYEARERPSKIYRWTTYVSANILIELFWMTLMAVLMYFCWYYPVGFVRNTTSDDQAIRGFLVFMFLWVFLLFASTFAHMAITWVDLPETAGVLTSLLWMLCILFCGIGVPPVDLPAFWKFMYRASPATYLVGGLMSTAVANSEVVCADYEVLHMSAPNGTSCGDFLGPFAEAAGGRVLNPVGREMCEYCPLGTTNDFLRRFELDYETRWRDFGLVWVYILVNIGLALGLYWVFRVPKGKGVKVKRA